MVAIEVGAASYATRSEVAPALMWDLVVMARNDNEGGSQPTQGVQRGGGQIAPATLPLPSLAPPRDGGDEIQSETILESES